MFLYKQMLSQNKDHHSGMVCMQVANLSEDDVDETEKPSKKSKKAAESIKVTDKMIKDWKAAMKKEPTPRVFREVTQAFKAAVATTKGEGGAQCKYKVADSSGKMLRC